MVILKSYLGLNIVFDEGLFYAVTKDSNIILTRKHKTLTQLLPEFDSITKSLGELGFI